MKLNARDKRTLIIGAAIAAMIVVYSFFIAPFTSDLSRKRDLIPKKERDLAEIRVLQKQYQEMQQRLQQAQSAAAKRGPILTEIENLTKRANLGNKIVSLKPQTGTQAAGFKESLVEVRFENITLYDAVNFVFLVEKAAFRIKKLNFKTRFDNPKLLNATLVIASAG